MITIRQEDNFVVKKINFYECHIYTKMEELSLYIENFNIKIRRVVKYHFFILIFFWGTTFSVFAQELQEFHKKHFSPEFRLSFNFRADGMLPAYGFGAGAYNVFFNQKRCNLITGLRIPVKEYEILIKCDYKMGMKKYFEISNIAGFNRYWRIGVGFKL